MTLAQALEKLRYKRVVLQTGKKDREKREKSTGLFLGQAKEDGFIFLLC